MFTPETAFKHLEWAGRRRLVWLGLPILLHAWTLGAPFLFDDLHLLRKTERYAAGQREQLKLFDFGGTPETRRELIDDGALPWWAPVDIRVSFFRPVAEWSLALDVLLFGRHAWAHRAVGLAWFALALLCVRRLYRAVGLAAGHAGVATLLFGVSQAAAGTLTLVCNRSDLLVLVGTTLAAAAYWSTLGRPRWRSVPLAAGGLTLAMLAKETGVPLVAVIVLHEILDSWRRRARPTFGPRLVLVASMTAILVVYLAYYVGTRPEPLSGLTSLAGLAGYGGRAVLNAGLYAAVWTLGFPIGVLLVQPSQWPAAVVAVAGALAAGGAAFWLCRAARRDAAARFFALWMLMFGGLALLVIPEPRGLCLATVGWAYLLAKLLIPAGGHPRPAPLWVRHVLLAANFWASIACALAVAAALVHAEARARDALRDHLAALTRPIQERDVLVVGAATCNAELGVAGDRLQLLTGLEHVSAIYLTAAGADADFRRSDDHTLTCTSRSPRLFNTWLHRRALGQHWRPHLGQTFHNRHFTAEITRIEDGLATGLQFRFSTPLDSPHLRFAPPTLGQPAAGGRGD